MKGITAVVLTKNEEQMLEDCLSSLSFCSEIIVVDTGSTDDTIRIAKKYTSRIFEDLTSDFSAKRNKGLEKAKYDWVFYLDADERVSPALRSSIEKVIGSTPRHAAYSIQRKNYYLGTPWPKTEQFVRLFRKESLSRWTGRLHESPVIEGEIGVLSGEIDHYTHRDLESMLAKTISWSEVEADLRYTSHHPKMTWWRFPRVMFSAFFSSYISQRGWKAGTSGMVESLYQMFSMFITYARLWEMQQEGRKER